MKKRVSVYIASLIMLSAILAVLLVMSSSAVKPSIPELLDKKGADFTDNSYIAQKLDELFALLPYSDYPYFTIMGNSSCGNSSCTSCNGKNVSRMHPMLKDAGVTDDYDSWSCFAFARYACSYIYGTKAYGLNYYGNTNGGLRRVGRIASQTADISGISGEYSDYTLGSLKALLSNATPGDILQVRSRSGSTVGNHTMLFLSCDADGVYVIHNNSYRTRTDADGNQYGYNRVLISFMAYESLMNTWGSIVTVYRAEENLYNEAWSKGGNICEKHTYTDEGGDYCVDCKTKFQRTVSADCAGIYTPVSTVSMHSMPYYSSSTSGNAPKTVTIISQEINSVGVKWYKTADGKYIPASALKEKTNDENVTIRMKAYPIGTKKLYNSFILKGTVRSSNGTNLDSVTGYIINSSGIISQSKTLKMNSSSLDIQTSDINYSLQFAKLVLGNYTFLVTAQDSSGKCSYFKSSFTISTKEEPYIKTDVDAPSKPTAVEVADTFVVLEDDMEFEFEYSINGIVWQSGSIFTDLNPNTEYTFYRRYAETQVAKASPASPPLVVITDYDKTPPSAPTLRQSNEPSVGDTWIILENEGAEYEYSCDAVHWQSSPEFKGLTPATNYMFFKRDKYAKVSSAGFLQRTMKSTISKPQPPEILTFSDNSVSLVYYDGFAYGIRRARSEDPIEWQDNNSFNGVFKNLLPATEYYIYCRVDESEYTFESAPSDPILCKTDKYFRKDVPAKPVVQTKNSSSVTLVYEENCEYSMNGREYTTNTHFTGLIPGVTYVFVCRYAENSVSYSSSDSKELVVEIVPDYVTSEIYDIDEENKLITNVGIGTRVAEFLLAFEEGKYASVYNESGRRLGGATVLTTGDRIVINDVSGISAEYEVIIKSDLNRDGKISLTDLLIMKEYLSGEKKQLDRLSNIVYDINSDGKINVIDYALLREMILAQ